MALSTSFPHLQSILYRVFVSISRYLPGPSCFEYYSALPYRCHQIAMHMHEP